jgi:hypothetical protein
MELEEENKELEVFLQSRRLKTAVFSPAEDRLAKFAG